MTQTSASSRLLSLDSLRGVAAVSVMMYHYTSRYQRLFGFENMPPMEVWYGRLGVNLFFMISGFVIFMTLERTLTATDFIISRFARLYPVFWVAVIFTYSIVWIFSMTDRQVNIIALVANFTMMPMLFRQPYIDGVYWTLQNELFFYGAMFIIYKLKLMNRIGLILLFWLTAAIVLPVAANSIGFDDALLYKVVINVFFFKWIPYFATGITFYQIHKSGSIAVNDILLFGLCLVRAKIDYSYDDFFIIIVFILIFFLFMKSTFTFMKSPILVFFGTISYSLYLVHQNLGYIVIQFVESRLPCAWLAVLLACIISVLFATLFTFAFERPCMKAIRNAYLNYKQQNNHLEQIIRK